MRVLITGAGGFLGRRLTQALLARGTLVGPGGQPEKIAQIILSDVAPIAPLATAEMFEGLTLDAILSSKALPGGTAPHAVRSAAMALPDRIAGAYPR